VRKSGDRWYIDVPSLALYAWAPSFLDAEPAAREVIAAVLDAEEHSFDVTIEFSRVSNISPDSRTSRSVCQKFSVL
jgi:hypothetical protein